MSYLYLRVNYELIGGNKLAKAKSATKKYKELSYKDLNFQKEGKLHHSRQINPACA